MGTSRGQAMEVREIDVITGELEKALEGKSVRYLFDNNLHQFIIENGGPAFHIYIHRKFFEEEDPMEILNEFYKYNVIDVINQATEPAWLYLSISGLQEVDENFANRPPS